MAVLNYFETRTLGKWLPPIQKAPEDISLENRLSMGVVNKSEQLRKRVKTHETSASVVRNKTAVHSLAKA